MGEAFERCLQGLPHVRKADLVRERLRQPNYRSGKQGVT